MILKKCLSFTRTEDELHAQVMALMNTAVLRTHVFCSPHRCINAGVLAVIRTLGKRLQYSTCIALLAQQHSNGNWLDDTSPTTSPSESCCLGCTSTAPGLGCCLWPWTADWSVLGVLVSWRLLVLCVLASRRSSKQ